MSTAPTPPPSPEDRLLLRCTRIALSPADEMALEQLVHESLDWNAVLARAVRHGITPLLYVHLSRPRLRSAVPPALLQQLDRFYAASRLIAMRQRFECARLLDALGRDGIEALPLKGMALREHVYPDPALRPSGDVDLLVPPAAAARAEEVLQRLGYVADEREIPAAWYRPENSHHLAPYRLPGREVLIEIHWGLAPPGAGLRINVEAVWERATAGEIAGRPVRLLAPEDLLLHLALHATVLTRFLTRLRHLVDVAETVRHFGARLDWGLLASRAREWRGQAELYTILRGADALLGLPEVPPAAWTWLRPAGFAEARVAAFGRRVLALGCLDLDSNAWATDYVAAFALAESWPEKIRLLAQVAFPPRWRMAELYRLSPDSRRVWGYYLLRPFDLLARYGRRIKPMRDLGRA